MNRMFIFLLALCCAAPVLARQDRPFRGGEYRTREAYTYGRFEVRMKSAAAGGMLTTFFTYHDPPSFSLAQWNEIDIEILGRYNNEVQFNTITPNQINHVQRQVVRFNPHDAFHVYGIEWTPDYVAWLVDGYEVYRQTADHIQTLTRAQKIMMNIWQPIYVDWVGSFDRRSLPLYGYYDWVRYSRYTPGENGNFTLVWHDDFDAYDSARWASATHTFDGNNARFIPDNVVFQDGYMILCLTEPQQTGYNGRPVVDNDVDPPYLVWARAENNSITAYFSEPVERASAEQPGNYTVTGATIRQALLQSDERLVRLFADSLNPSASYLLVASQIQDQSGNGKRMPLQFVQVSTALQVPARFNAGGAAAEGWLADQEWRFGVEYGAVGGRMQRLADGQTVTGTTEPQRFTSYREGLSFFRVRLPDGRYRLTFSFAEPVMTAAGRRVFDVSAGGTLLLDDVDIFAAAGQFAALELSAEVDVSDGLLDLYFRARAGEPVLAGLKIEAAQATEVRFGELVPEQFRLDVYPNPFNPQTTIRYSLPQPATVRLSIFNSLGQRVRELLRQSQPAGEHAYQLDASDLTSGVYFVQLQAGNKLQAGQKVLLLK